MSLEKKIAEKVTKEVTKATVDGISTIGKSVSEFTELDSGPEDFFVGLMVGIGEAATNFFDGTQENIDKAFKPLEDIAEFLDDLFS